MSRGGGSQGKARLGRIDTNKAEEKKSGDKDKITEGNWSCGQKHFDALGREITVFLDRKKTKQNTLHNYLLGLILEFVTLFAIVFGSGEQTVQ